MFSHFLLSMQERLWTPSNSGFLREREWIDERFPKDLRFEYAIFHVENE